MPEGTRFNMLLNTALVFLELLSIVNADPINRSQLHRLKRKRQLGMRFVCQMCLEYFALTCEK